jgi:hypothetical protein
MSNLEHSERVWMCGWGKRQKLTAFVRVTGRIDHAFDMAEYFATTLENRKGFHLVSENPPPCLQV